ncbi:MAG: methyltransferase domain-containing protein, partial [Pseudonocardia sp.]|nr:methyltransferase domain-containing protein [Pseudonocardia sp.]
MTEPDFAACCAQAYSSDLVALLLGESYHPGGLALTRRLADRIGLAAGQRVLDVAAGRGATGLMLARERGVHVDGVDLSAANVALADGAAQAAGLAGQATFVLGDSVALPFPDGRFDAVICECAWCTFPDKAAAAAEFARVLRPGGHLGITDVTALPGALPDELSTPAARIACVADARPLAGYADLLAAAGLRVRHAERHDAALLAMIDQIEARLALIRMTGRAGAEALGLDFA